MAVFPLPRALIAVAGIVLLGFAALVLRRRDRPAATTFGSMLVTLSLAALLTAATVPTPAINKFVWLLGFLFIPLALTLFSFDYYGLSYLTTRRRRVLFVAPIALGVLGGIVHILGTPAYTAGDAAVISALAGLPEWVVGLTIVAERIGIYYAGGLMFVAMGLVLSTVLEYEHLDAGLGTAVVTLGGWPWLVYLLMPAVLPRVGPGAVLWAFGACFSASVVLAAVSLWYYDLFEAAPAAGNLGPERVITDLDDAVVLLDRDERILRLNRAAEMAFDVTAAGVVGSDFRSLVQADLETLRSANTFQLRTSEGQRRYEATVSEITDRRNDVAGYGLVLRDVTERLTREQRLAVLNRVLRHNLRNEMTTIIGRAEIVAAEDEFTDVAESILNTADTLVELGEKARDVEGMMSVTQRLGESTDLAALADNVVDTVAADHPAASYNVDVPGEIEAGVDGRLLEPVLRNLVENAVEHNEADQPHVDVTAETTTEPAGLPVQLTVADNGPGIPDDERQVLAEGEEEPLKHGSGLGLWAVHWGVRRMGGSLDFADREGGGTAVTIRLPWTEAPESSAEAAVPSPMATSD